MAAIGTLALVAITDVGYLAYRVPKPGMNPERGAIIRSLLTHRVISRPSIIALRKAHSITSSARLSKGLRQRYTESLRSLGVRQTLN